MTSGTGPESSEPSLTQYDKKGQGIQGWRRGGQTWDVRVHMRSKKEQNGNLTAPVNTWHKNMKLLRRLSPRLLCAPRFQAHPQMSVFAALGPRIQRRLRLHPSGYRGTTGSPEEREACCSSSTNVVALKMKPAWVVRSSCGHLRLVHQKPGS